MSDTDTRACTSSSTSGSSLPGSSHPSGGRPATIVQLVAYIAATADSPARLDLALHGDIDLADAELLQDRLEQVTAFPPCPVTVDLSAVTFLCSSGLNFLCRVLQHADAGGHSVTLAGPIPIARRAIQVCGLDQVFVIIDCEGARGHAVGVPAS